MLCPTAGAADKKDWNDRSNCVSTQNGYNQRRFSVDLNETIPVVKVSVEEKEIIMTDPAATTFAQVAQTNVGCMLEEAPLLFKHA